MFTLDTNIVIDYLKSESVASLFISKAVSAGSRFYLSVISETELFGYPLITPGEITKIDELLDTVVIIPIDSKIARTAGYFKRSYNISIPDAIIATTALLTNSMVITRNLKHFQRIKEIKAQSP